MNDKRKGHFWDKFILNQRNPSAYFRRNSGTSNFLAFDDNGDSDSEYDVVVTPAADYHRTSSDPEPIRSRSTTRHSHGSDHSHVSTSSRNKEQKKTVKRGRSRKESESSSSSSRDRDTKQDKHKHRSKSKKYRNKVESDDSESDDSDSADSFEHIRDLHKNRTKERGKKDVHKRRNRHDETRSPVNRRKHNRRRSSSSIEDDVLRMDKRSKSRMNAMKKQTTESQRKSKGSREEDSDNWSLHRREVTDDGLTLKITMEDLQKVIQANVQNAVKNSIPADIRHHNGRTSPDILTTDTETFNSGLSFSSYSSNEALLHDRRLLKDRRKSGSFPNRNIPQKHGSGGYLRRCIPFTIPPDNAGHIQSVSGSIPSQHTDDRRKSIRTADQGLLTEIGTLRGSLADQKQLNKEIEEELFYRKLDERISQKVEAAKLSEATNSDKKVSQGVVDGLYQKPDSHKNSSVSFNMDRVASIDDPYHSYPEDIKQILNQPQFRPYDYLTNRRATIAVDGNDPLIPDMFNRTPSVPQNLFLSNSFPNQHHSPHVFNLASSGLDNQLGSKPPVSKNSPELPAVMEESSDSIDEPLRKADGKFTLYNIEMFLYTFCIGNIRISSFTFYLTIQELSDIL